MQRDHRKVLVLGGGLMGLAVAHGLARSGWSVELLSRNRREAAGFVAAGMLAPHAEGLQGDLLLLAQRSLDLVPEWVRSIEQDSGLPCGWRTCGIVVPLRDATASDTLPTARYGRYLDREALEQQVPGIGRPFRCGVLFPQDGQLDNRRQLMVALEQACIHLGVQMREGVEVERLCCTTGRDGTRRLQGVELRTASGHRQRLPCRQAVLCCGAWSGNVLPVLPVFPMKGQMLSLQAPRDALQRVLYGPGTYLVPRRDGLVVVGATSEAVGFEAGLTPAGQQQLEAGLAGLLPEAAGWPLMERWWGFRPCTPDQAPLLGPGPMHGLTLATGHHRNGVLLAAITAAVTGQVVAAWHEDGSGESGDPALAAFRWNRFAPTV